MKNGAAFLPLMDLVLEKARIAPLQREGGVLYLGPQQIKATEDTDTATDFLACGVCLLLTPLLVFLRHPVVF